VGRRITSSAARKGILLGDDSLLINILTPLIDLLCGLADLLAMWDNRTAFKSSLTIQIDLSCLSPATELFLKSWPSIFLVL